MRKTKIICTIGPATDSYSMLEKMYHTGMNVVRLNMSHGDHKSHAKIIKAIKTLNKNVEFPVPVLLDTQGPEIRTGQLDSSLDLKKGDLISVSVSPNTVEKRSIHIDYADLLESVNIGDRITVDNGLINLEVLDKSEKSMQCRVIDGGKLKSKSHVNLPGVRVNLPGITAKDHKDILFGIEQEVDFIAMSFVREANDIVELRKLMGKKAGKIKIIAKIEDQEAIENIEEIIDEADGVMVARGDLGVEIPFENLPNVQRRIVRLCHQKGKRVIVATHLLESMIDNPMPTRAEATDVANAVYEEVDAVMLSGETTVGKYPLKAIEALDRIAQVSEQARGLQFANVLIKDCDKQFLAASAVEMAESLGTSGIVVITRRGLMANYLANCLPAQTRIFAFTNDSRTRRQLSLSRGVIPYRTTFSQDPEKTLTTAFNLLKKKQGFSAGDKVVVISDVIAGQGIDAIQIRSLP